MRDALKIPLILAVAGVLLAASAGVQEILARKTDSAQQVARSRELSKRHPEYLFLTIAPGGLRAPMINWLWIHAEEQKNQGRFYDAKQSADLICSLQPRFAGAWAFNAWNMAYNISVQTHTAEERWNWVYNGIKLLRDRGIQYNPDELDLYKELAWIFQHKLGGYTDEMHVYYKRKWAGMMQRLLAPPMFGSVEDIRAHFRPIAEAPLDRRPVQPPLPVPWAALVASMALVVAGLICLAVPRFHGLLGFSLAGVLLVAGSAVFGASMYFFSGSDAVDDADALTARQRLLADEGVRAYVARLRKQGVGLDASLLEAFNRLGDTEALRAVRLEPPKIQTERDRKLSELFNDPRWEAAREKTLAFVRAQILWNRYKMDPAWMMDLMDRFGPVDWRTVQAHGLYWSTYGLHAIQGTRMDDMEHHETLNTARHQLNCLKDLTWSGRLMYTENPRDPNLPFVEGFFEPRLVDPMMAEYDRFRRRARDEREEDSPRHNMFQYGHENYLVAVMQALYPLHERKKAQEIYEYIKETYPYNKDGMWELPLEEFLVRRYRVGGVPIRRYAMTQISAALRAAYVLWLRGRGGDYDDNMKFAARLYEIASEEKASDRLALPPLEAMKAQELARLLVTPKAFGYTLDLDDRSRLWSSPKVSDEMRRMIYDSITSPLRMQCERWGVDFQVAFPEPAGMEDYRRRRRAAPGEIWGL